ncbi:MAG: asparagine synthase (glutamine-hydrolyzing) [Pyrinomonadaceae bacterium]|nr:asparagine synthase (glutamine-hydrolyzing) [Pyrinomonadaceae bacterium]
MCGIAGFIDSEMTRDYRERESLLDQMCKVITHRGPDEQGMAVVGRAALGMRRLSIIDLKTGQQPIYSTDGSKLIVFNGEIYNYLELKKELEGLGYRFKTNSDTETIIHAFDEFGPDCVRKLRGMFAFAIWDEKAQSLFVARDRVGKKPLFYTLLPNGDFVFGSELKCLLTHGGLEKKVDLGAINSYLTFGYVPEEFCVFEGVKKLVPGHVLTLDRKGITTNKYWDFEYRERYEECDEGELIEDLRSEIEDAVKARLISEVPLGAFLSGGVDSSAIVGMMSRISGKAVKTFSIGFNEDSFSELKYARIAAKHFNTDHHEFIVTPDLVETVDELVWHLDEPFSDPSTMPTFMVSKMARDFVTVVLSGDGGDELFAGYSRYQEDRNPNVVSGLPAGVREKLMRPLSEAMPHSARGKNFLYNASLGGIERYIDSVSQFGMLKKKSLYSANTQSALGPDISEPEELFARIAASGGKLDPLSRLLYLDSKTYLISDILTKVDRMSMAASLEARVPLLDQNLIDFVTRRVPPGLKMKGDETKYIFKKALEGIVPNEILYREKQGFGVPIAEWINTKLRKTIVNTLLEHRTLERGYFEREYIETLVSEHAKGRRDHSHPLWVLWVLELWHRRYVDGS